VTRLASGIKGYTHWRKALWADETLRAEAKRCHWDPRTVAEVIALFGVNGRYCCISAATAAERIGCSMNTVKNHRTLLIRLGWLMPTDKQAGRLVLLSISLPKPIDQRQLSIDQW
jgi:Helix-turn-helix domain